MRKPATADERDRRFVEYLTRLDQGRLAEFRLTRMNRIANFRKQLKELLDEIIESRAEEIAAGMLMEYAPKQQKQTLDAREGRLPLPIGPKKARIPVWLRKSAS